MLLLFLIVAMISFEDLRILSWNVRGAMNGAGRRHARELVCMHKPNLVFLVETHCVFKKAENFWNSLGFHGIAISEAPGQSGGIWILLEKASIYSVSVVDMFNQAVWISISRGNRTWYCSAIYASPIPANRELLWSHLQQLRNMIHGPW